jgi:alpha-tubulin suppressor-like RCC1 family protein
MKTVKGVYELIAVILFFQFFAGSAAAVNPMVAAGNTLTVGLKTDGTVLSTKYDVSSWSGIVKVAVGPDHILGVKADGTVVAAGSNGLGQCNVSG